MTLPCDLKETLLLSVAGTALTGEEFDRYVAFLRKRMSKACGFPVVVEVTTEQMVSDAIGTSEERAEKMLEMEERLWEKWDKKG